MNQQIPVIIVITPLMLAIVTAFIGRRHEGAAFFLAVTAMLVCLICSVFILLTINAHGVIEYRLGGWPPPVGIVYRIDHLNAFMLILICFIGAVSAIHAKKSVEKELPDRIYLFWCLFLLLITGLLGITITGDLFNLFVFLEVASLSGYALVAVGSRESTVAGIRYLILGSIGACFYLLGVGYLYIATGTLNMTDLTQLLPELIQSRTILMGFAFILIGISIKTALFPMHTWLPDAYTLAPSAVSAVVAPLMTKVMAYVLIRVMFTVFEPAVSRTLFGVTDMMVWMGTLAMLFGATAALSQKDFKRMLSYVIIAEIGYIIGGIGVANAIALKGAVFHIISDAVMMACLFLIAGQVMYKKDGHAIDNFTGIFHTMPVTAAIFTIGSLAVIGVPPTCGFFSKWYLLLGGIHANQWGFVAALLICTLINIALFFKILDKALFVNAHGTFTRTMPANMSQAGEAPLIMLVPAAIMAFAIVLVGVFNQFIINRVLNFTVF